MTANEAAIQKAYQVAEDKDVLGWANCFTKDGTFTDESIGVTYRGPDELGRTVEIYATAFPDMHRELYNFYVDGDTVVSGATYETRAEVDPLFTRPQVAELVHSYLGSADARHPLASPLRGRHSGMPS